LCETLGQSPSDFPSLVLTETESDPSSSE
jgi:hypothetical protein